MRELQQSNTRNWLQKVCEQLLSYIICVWCLPLAWWKRASHFCNFKTASTSRQLLKVVHILHVPQSSKMIIFNNLPLLIKRLTSSRFSPSLSPGLWAILWSTQVRIVHATIMMASIRPHWVLLQTRTWINSLLCPAELCVCVCVCVCVCERERERAREGGRERERETVRR